MASILTVGGIDRSNQLTKGSLSITLTMGSEPNTMSFRMPGRTLGPTVKPTPGQEVTYTDSEGNLLFGGSVMRVDETPIGKSAMEYDVKCTDWRKQADSRLINEQYIGLTAGQIIVSAFAEYAPQFDTSSVPLGGIVIPSLSIRRELRITGLLDRLSDYTGFAWDILPNKEVFWGPPGSILAPWNLSDSSLDFSGLSWAPNVEQLRNRVVVSAPRRPASYQVTDRHTGDALTLNFRMSQPPYGDQNYIEFDYDFRNGIDSSIWIEQDITNPSPPPGHISSDGFLFTTKMEGGVLTETGWLQIVGGTNVMGPISLRSFETFGRGGGRRRFEGEIHVVSANTKGAFGLWDPTQPSSLSGAIYGALMSAGTLIPLVGGTSVSASNVVTYADDSYLRWRITPGVTSGAMIEVNQNPGPTASAVAWPPSDWKVLAQTASATASALAYMAIMNGDFNGRARRPYVFNPYLGMSVQTLSVTNALIKENVIGILDRDNDSGADCLVGTRQGIPVLAFFGDNAPQVHHTISHTYNPAIPLLVQVEDEVAISVMRALENPGGFATGASGIYEHIIQDNQIDSIQLGLQRGTQEIETYGNPSVDVGYATWRSGLYPGQVQNVVLTYAGSGRDINSAFLIQSIGIKSEGDGVTHKYTVSGTTRLKGVQDLLYELLQRSYKADDQTDPNQALDELISKSEKVFISDELILSGTPNISKSESVIIGDDLDIAIGPDPLGTFLYGVATFGSALLS